MLTTGEVSTDIESPGPLPERLLCKCVLSFEVGLHAKVITVQKSAIGTLLSQTIAEIRKY
jgi:hypothetical protein